MEYLLHLFITIIIETPIIYYLIKDRNLKKLGLIILMNLISNPLLNYFYLEIFDASLSALFFLEISITLIEGLIIYKLNNSNKWSFYISFIANLGSLLIGSIINKYLIVDYNSFRILLFIVVPLLIVELLIIILLRIIKKYR